MPDPIPQAAAIPLRGGRVCLVTSRSKKRRWVIPKGRIDPGHTPAEAAAAETWEEAGLIGVVRDDAVGTYRYAKYGRDHAVTVFVMDVTDVRIVWPEHRQRDREWLDLDEAIARVDEPELRAILAAVADGTTQPVL